MKTSDKPPLLPEKNAKKKNVKSLGTALGPVINLEEHVKSDWWRQIFNAMYLKTDGDVVDDYEITRREMDIFLNIIDVNKDDRVLDLCCGQGRHSLELTRRGFNDVYGLDRSRYLISRAKGNARKEGLSTKFKEGDARKIQFNNDFFYNVMILGNSFGYFESINDDLAVLKEVSRVLRPYGKLLIDVTDGDYLRNNFQKRSWEWIDKKLFVCRERSLSHDQQKLISREIVSHTEKGVLVDQFYSERIYTPQTLSDLLKLAGFSNIQLHTHHSTESTRNQDLGMMEKRIIVTATVRKEWSPVKTRKKTDTKEIVVVMGDPYKPDSVKPAGYFENEDFATINKLKSALKKVEEESNYRFSYITNHFLLMQDLQKLKNDNKLDFIFNLCDEGFMNDPKKELHVPALLDVLGISYSGAGPQCLAHCYDKSLVRGIAGEMGVPIPEAYFIKPEDTTFELNVPFPVIAKPNFGDGSFGITQKSVAYNIEELINAVTMIRDQLGYTKPILIEQFLPGKDLSIGIIGNPPDDYRILPLIETDYTALPDDLPQICGYESKWLPDSDYYRIKSVPARLDENKEKIIIEKSLELTKRLECRDYVRLDWRMDAEGSPRLLEVNPNPGWCWDGHLAAMAEIEGFSYHDMLKLILDAACKRIGVCS